MFEFNYGLVIVINEESFDPKRRVDLESSNVEVKVNGFVAHVSVDLTYKNYSEEEVEVAYNFPVDVRSAIYSFEAKLDGRTIIAHCLEKNKAEELYDNAVEEGYTAILGSEDRYCEDLMSLNLGNFPKGETANLKLKLVIELPVKTDGAVDFTLPTVFNPRYSPKDHPASSSRYVDYDSDSRYVIPNKHPYSLYVKAQIEGSFEIARVKSLNNSISVQLDDTKCFAEISQDKEMNYDQDWSFQIYYQSVHKPHCLQMEGDRTNTGFMYDDIIMLNLFPEVPLLNYNAHNEIIFVVDRSGSMMGKTIKQAKKTLLLFLKSLPLGCRFNIVSFGTTFSKLFESSSEPYTKQTLTKALKLQKSIRADMGGTEIYLPLHHIYSKKLIPGYSRQIIILTDGGVWNQDQIFELIKINAQESRVFSVGIGYGASTALVEGMAKAGRGRSEMVIDEDLLQMRVMGLMASMLQDQVNNITVEWKVSPPQVIKLVPEIPPNIFGGQHLILYARLKANSKIESIKVSWKIGDNESYCELKEEDCKSVSDSNFSFHRLAAKAQLYQWLKENDGNLEDIINLSITSSVVCKLTSFVGFDQDRKICSVPVEIRELNLQFYSLAIDTSPSDRINQSAIPNKVKRSINFKSSGRPRSKSVFSNIFKKPFTNISFRRSLSGSEECLGQDGYSSTIKSNYNNVKDLLIDIVSAQNFDGFWTMQDCFRILNLKKHLCSKIGKTLSLSENMLATVLVLAYFEVKFESRKAEWSLVSLKANNYLQANNIDVSDVVERCILEIKNEI